jgi:hypothetical protein
MDRKRPFSQWEDLTLVQREHILAKIDSALVAQDLRKGDSVSVRALFELDNGETLELEIPSSWPANSELGWGYMENRFHASKTLDQACALLDSVELLVPPRIRDEELGDAREIVYRLVREGAPRWKIFLKVATTFFWVGVNTIREVIAGLAGQKAKK